MNPFKYGQVVRGRDFCPRPELQTALASHVESRQNVHVTGERRTGKTSLILETVSKLKLSLIHVDLFQVKSTHDVYMRMLDGVLTHNTSTAFVKRLMQGIASLRPTMSYDQVSGAPSISIAPSENVMPATVVGLLDFIREKLGQRGLVVFIDEFQDVTELKEKDEMLALMRSRIQLHADITYVYAGSVRRRMDDIFYNPDSPFYKSALPVKVESLNSLTFSNYLMQRFASGGRPVSGEIIEQIFDLTHSNPGDVQELCNALWDVTADESAIRDDDVGRAVMEIFIREKPYYEQVVSAISDTQLRFLRGLAEFDGKQIYSRAFLEYTGIKQPASVTRALKRMVDLKVVYTYGKQHKFASPFFRLWLLDAVGGKS